MSSEIPSAQDLILSISNSISKIALHCKEIQTASQGQTSNKQIIEDTKSLINQVKTKDLKRLLEIKINDNKSIKIAQKKLAKDFDQVVHQFKETLKISAQNPKGFYKEEDEENPSENTPLLQEQLHAHNAALNSQIELNERIITERDEDLAGLEQSIAEVHEIFRDIGTLVNEQQYLLDNIENNVANVSIHMQGATSELRQAANYQNSTGKTYLWIFLILLIIAIIVILSMQPWKWGKPA